ncbi:AraC family transcriptional regulator [Rhizobium sullae]|uniref:AraC family transcriptional regulator n=1 Tax=Rhizobium sullae TaxID=50338 RepID=UPI001FCCC682|nr:AraC family transcriptional regulator [Rhizobium sullae]
MHEYNAVVGAITIRPAQVDGWAEWASIKETLIFALKPQSLLELATGEFDLAEVELQPPAFGTVDLKALRIAELLKMELMQQGPPSALYVDSLLTLFGIHLLRNYSALRKHTMNLKGGLSASGARRIHEFVHENFTRKIAVAELAAIADLSPYYFIRAFTKRFGQPPHQYVLFLRLSFAERLLVEGKETIAEIAYLAGFSSQSHLTASMRKYRQVTPAELRAKK